MDDKPTSAQPSNFLTKMPTSVKPTPSPAAPKAPPSGASAPTRSASSGPRPNPNTAASGVPRPSGQVIRQLDGTKSQTMTPPVKRAPLATRQSSPGSSHSGGIERSMSDLADQLHPPKRK